MTEKTFNIRVYGLLINDQNEVLLSDEIVGSHRLTKFPGGGLEHGEGVGDCVVREYKEELGIDIEIVEHYYTTDYFQPSMFRDSDQVISIYYKVTTNDWSAIYTTNEPFAFEAEGSKQGFRWAPISALTPSDVTLPIDKKVVGMLSS